MGSPRPPARTQTEVLPDCLSPTFFHHKNRLPSATQGPPNRGHAKCTHIHRNRRETRAALGLQLMALNRPMGPKRRGEGKKGGPLPVAALCRRHRQAQASAEPHSSSRTPGWRGQVAGAHASCTLGIH